MSAGVFVFAPRERACQAKLALKSVNAAGKIAAVAKAVIQAALRVQPRDRLAQRTLDKSTSRVRIAGVARRRVQAKWANRILAESTRSLNPPLAWLARQAFARRITGDAVTAPRAAAMGANPTGRLRRGLRMPVCKGRTAVLLAPVPRPNSFQGPL